MTDRLLDAMAGSAARRYGTERVSELAHALQCAELAREAGADEELTLACLLHDVGRFAVDQALVFDRVGGGRARARRGHHEIGADLIAPYVPERVTWLVRMHADAKRYLCSTEPGYHATLSPASQHTMTLQGGLMSPEEIARHARASLARRRAAPAALGRPGQGGRQGDARRSRPGSRCSGSYFR